MLEKLENAAAQAFMIFHEHSVHYLHKHRRAENAEDRRVASYLLLLYAALVHNKSNPALIDVI